jgi:hypothetical protein
MLQRLGIVLLLFISACTPGTFAPGSRANPIRSSVTETAKVSQNSDVFVVTPGPIRSASRTQINDAFGRITNSYDPVKGQKDSIEVYWFRIEKVSAPEGMDVTLVSQKAVREVGEVGQRGFTVFDSLELTFNVRVKSSVPLGSYSILVTLINPENGLVNSAMTGSALLRLQVVAP